VLLRLSVRALKLKTALDNEGSDAMNRTMMISIWLVIIAAATLGMVALQLSQALALPSGGPL
jgi:hypothetical protein